MNRRDEGGGHEWDFQPMTVGLDKAGRVGSIRDKQSLERRFLI